MSETPATLMALINKSAGRIADDPNRLKAYLYLTGSQWDFKVFNNILLADHFADRDIKGLYFIEEELPDVEKEIYEKELEDPESDKQITKIEILKPSSDNKYKVVPLYETSRISVLKPGENNYDYAELLTFIYYLMINGIEFIEGDKITGKQTSITNVIRLEPVEELAGFAEIKTEKQGSVLETVLKIKPKTSKDGCISVFFEIIKNLAFEYLKSDAEYLEISEGVKLEIASLIAYTYCDHIKLSPDKINLDISKICKASETPGKYGTGEFNTLEFMKFMRIYEKTYKYILACIDQVRAKLEEEAYNFEQLMSDHDEEEEEKEVPSEMLGFLGALDDTAGRKYLSEDPADNDTEGFTPLGSDELPV